MINLLDVKLTLNTSKKILNSNTEHQIITRTRTRMTLKEKTCLLIDITVSINNNIIKE